MHRPIRFGTRQSKLARAQTEIVVRHFSLCHPTVSIEIIPMVTSGDNNQTSSLSEIGGKGLFIKELEHALLQGTIDVAIHSFKDITSQLAEGLELCFFIKPDSAADVLISNANKSFDSLDPGSRIGTSSMRRKALIKEMRNDLVVCDIRGNVDTRLAKLNSGGYEALILSEAGLIRLGLEGIITQRFDPLVFLPAPGQGVIACEIRKEDTHLSQLFAPIQDKNQYLISQAEIAVLSCLGFNCQTPLGIYTTLSNGTLHMYGFYVQQSTGTYIKKEVSGPAYAPEEVGFSLSRLLIEKSAHA